MGGGGAGDGGWGVLVMGGDGGGGAGDGGGGGGALRLLPRKDNNNNNISGNITLPFPCPLPQVENTIRWRYSQDEDGNEVRDSNARVVRWTDGSMSLYLGSEIFDITKQPLQGEYSHLFVRQGIFQWWGWLVGRGRNRVRGDGRGRGGGEGRGKGGEGGKGQRR